MRSKRESPRCLHTGLSVDDGIVIDKSRMNREVHVRFRESLWVKLPLATRLGGGRYFPLLDSFPEEIETLCVRFSHIRLSEKDVPTPIAWRLWTYDSGRRFISPGRPAASSCTSLSKISPSPRFPPCHLLISLLQSTHPKQEKRLHRRCFSVNGQA